MSIRRMEILINAVKSWYFRILARSPRLEISGCGVISLVHPRCSYLINNTANDLWQRGSRVSSYVRQYIDWLFAAAAPRLSREARTNEHLSLSAIYPLTVMFLALEQ